MAKKKKSNIVRYRHPRNINIGMMIFAIIFVYLLFSVYTYMKKEKVQFYEVVEGNIVNDRQYTGIILRDERVENTDRAGYINYYIRYCFGLQKWNKTGYKNGMDWVTRIPKTVIRKIG